MELPVYLDTNASSHLHADAAAAMVAAIENDRASGNPSSGHVYGAEGRKGVEESRRAVAALIGGDGDEVVFTGGGTESNNMALRGLGRWMAETGRWHVVTSSVEHPAVGVVLEHMCAEHAGQMVTTVVGVDAHCAVDIDAVVAAITPDTAVVTLMLANNEVGALTPLARVAAACAAAGALLHTDASQAVGKVPVDVAALGVDLLTIAGHKLHGPKGIGALWIGPRAADKLAPFMLGAGHEGGRRAGTESTILIAGLGAAAAAAAREIDDRVAHTAATRNALWRILADGLPPGAVLANTDMTPGAALPNTLSVSFRSVLAPTLLAAVAPVLAASAGAACHSGDVAVSATITAMGVPDTHAPGTVRLSTSMFTTMADVERAGAALVAAWNELAGASE